MVKAISSIIIDKPAQEVYNFLMDESNFALWQSGIIKASATNGLHQGSKLRVTSNNLGREFGAEAEVTENDGDQNFTIVSTAGPLQFKLVYHLKEIEHATELTVENEVSTHMFFKLAEPVIQYLSENKLEGDLKNLKILLEGTKP